MTAELDVYDPIFILIGGFSNVPLNILFQNTAFAFLSLIEGHSLDAPGNLQTGSHEFRSLNSDSHQQVPA